MPGSACVLRPLGGPCQAVRLATVGVSHAELRRKRLSTASQGRHSPSVSASGGSRRQRRWRPIEGARWRTDERPAGKERAGDERRGEPSLLPTAKHAAGLRRPSQAADANPGTGAGATTQPMARIPARSDPDRRRGEGIGTDPPDADRQRDPNPDHRNRTGPYAVSNSGPAGRPHTRSQTPDQPAGSYTVPGSRPPPPAPHAVPDPDHPRTGQRQPRTPTAKSETASAARRVGVSTWRGRATRTGHAAGDAGVRPPAPLPGRRR